MPDVANEDWIVRLRAKLGIVVKKDDKQICLSRRKTKPVEADLPLANESCSHPAGSLQKIEVMRQRVERGEAVFHPNDNRNIVIGNNARAS